MLDGTYLGDLITRYMLYLKDVLRGETAQGWMKVVHRYLKQWGFPEPYPNAEQVAISMAAGVFTLVGYYVICGKRHRSQRKQLQRDLIEARSMVNELEEKIAEIEEEELKLNKRQKKPIRVWMDGAFDMMHYGHMNAFRQGRALGTYLVVGINSDASIKECKGPPVMNDDERTVAVAGCKFVDEVEPNCPYIMNEEYLNYVIKKHKLDYIVHGDDPCIVDGKDVYETAKKMGIYRSIPRTEGVSTTEIVGRMLLLTKEHHQSAPDADGTAKLVSKGATTTSFERRSKFLTTNRMLRLFSAGNKDPPSGAKIIYIDGGWDMFHAGHVKILKMAKDLGDYLIVGVHNDVSVNKHYGSNYPIMNMQERVLSVLGCKYVDDILLDAPWDITREMIASLNIHLIVHGTRGDYRDLCAAESQERYDMRYKVAKEMGKFKELQSPSELTIKEIVNRIRSNEQRLQEKFNRKIKQEEEYYENRYKDIPGGAKKT